MCALLLVQGFTVGGPVHFINTRYESADLHL